MAQEPEDADQVETCVRTKFGVGFELLEKVNVNGPTTHPVFQWLRLAGSEDCSAIGWNFSMFLVSKDGMSCTRFPNTLPPLKIRENLEAALGESDGLSIQPSSPDAKAKVAPPGDSPASVMASQ